MPTDEDIVRDLLHRYAPDVRPDTSIAAAVVARQRRRDRNKLVSLAATAAALGTAAGVIAIVPGHAPSAGNSASGNSASGNSASGNGATIRLTADQHVIYGLSSAAARQPEPQGRYAVMKTEGTDVKDTSVIDTTTGNMWSYQAGTDGTPSGKGYRRGYSPTAAQFAAMPTSPAALRAALITQWDAQHKQDSAAMNAAREQAKMPTVTPIPVAVTSSDKVFQQASDLLWNPLVGPSLRAALYKVLADVPGVSVSTAAHDAAGRPAVELRRTDNSGVPGGKSDGQSYATYESPATGSVLESTVTYPPGSGATTPQDPKGAGTVADTTVYLSVTWSGSVPADPYGG
jgi:hypothetical protein